MLDCGTCVESCLKDSCPQYSQMRLPQFTWSVIYLIKQDSYIISEVDHFELLKFLNFKCFCISNLFHVKMAKQDCYPFCRGASLWLGFNNFLSSFSWWLLTTMFLLSFRTFTCCVFHQLQLVCHSIQYFLSSQKKDLVEVCSPITFSVFILQV